MIDSVKSGRQIQQTDPDFYRNDWFCLQNSPNNGKYDYSLRLCLE